MAGTVLGSVAQALGPLLSQRHETRTRAAERADRWREARRSACTTFLRLVDEFHESGRALVATTTDRGSSEADLYTANQGYLAAWTRLTSQLGDVELVNDQATAAKAVSAYDAAAVYSEKVEQTRTSHRWTGDEQEGALIAARRVFITVARRSLSPSGVSVA